MPRPTKCRRVEFFPDKTYFTPLGNNKYEIQEIILKIEELEAIRLKDIEKLTQEECAKRMHVSRQTFQNIIDGARKKVAVALTEGKAIKISGGHYTTNLCKFKCLDCGNIYDINYEQDRDNCPTCNSEKVVCNKKNEFCHRWCNTR